MRIRAPPGREESMERTKDFYNGMDYAKKQLQQGWHMVVYYRMVRQWLQRRDQS